MKAAGADYVKIGSGMGPRNPTIEDFLMVKEIIGDTIKIKVAGGITSGTLQKNLSKQELHVWERHML